MGRKKPGKPRRPSRRPSTADIVQALAKEYRCGHCRSRTRAVKDAGGAHHLVTDHEPSCPTRTGVVDVVPDTLRAVDRAMDRAADGDDAA